MNKQNFYGKSIEYLKTKLPLRSPKGYAIKLLYDKMKFPCEKILLSGEPLIVTSIIQNDTHTHTGVKCVTSSLIRFRFDLVPDFFCCRLLHGF